MQVQAIAHNLASQFTSRQLNINTTQKRKSAEKLSSGYRINRSADDAAGLKISEKMRSQIRGLKRGKQNTQEGISWLQTADGAMDQIADIMQRIRELAVQASNDTYLEEDKFAINEEIKALKLEINRIALGTEFNKEPIFDNSYVTMDISGTPQDLEVFDASYDDVTGDVSWGGFLFHGERIPWDTVSPGMVQVDAATGKQVFVGGEYSYTDAATGCKFNISCKSGEEPPKITRSLELSADSSGVHIDGTVIPWSKVYDEDDAAASAGAHGGAWWMEYEGATVAFFVGQEVDTVSDLASAINSCHNGKVTYTWKTEFAGTSEETAVDASLVKDIRISNAVAKKLEKSDDFKYVVRAGDGKNGSKDGIWLEDKDGNEVNGSFRSWAEMNISSWMEGNDIQSSLTYTYSDTEGTEDTYLAFDFMLSDVTSKDSVIDGLDGMEISGKNIKTNYDTNLDIPLNGNVVKAELKSSNYVRYEEERGLGRDFDAQSQERVGDSDVLYDEVTGEALLEYKDPDGNTALSYSGNVERMQKDLEGDINTYLQYVLRRKRDIALAGGDPQKEELGSGSLTDLLGEDKITTSGYFDGKVTIDEHNMALTDGESSYYPGKDGMDYISAFVDFSGLGSEYTLDDLIGLGFNSTCKTCDNHYSIIFMDGASGSTSAGGFEYNFKNQGRDYALQIDIGSLKANGVVTGADLAKAIVDITAECYDFHYTQYAADNSGKLYVYDDREDESGARNATFDTAPFNAIDTDELHLSLESADGRRMDLSYTYDFGDVADCVQVNMAADANGEYVRLADGSYEAYDSQKHGGLDRYTMEIAYKNKSDGSDAADLAGVMEDYVRQAMDDTLGNSNIHLDATDYTYLDIDGQENHNVAVRAEFESHLEESPYDNGLHIQNSSIVYDSVEIPRFALNTVVLGMYRAGAKNYEQAQATIGYMDHALGVLSGRRTLYGAWQNRLEHICSVSEITEENTQAAESRIRDTDMAEETVNFSKHNILEQSGQAILSQANQKMEGVLALLGGI